MPINGKSLPRVLIVASFIFLILLILYLTNNLIPSVLSNPPDYDLYNQALKYRTPGPEETARILRYWPNVFVSLLLFFLFFFSLVFGLGYNKRLKGQTWHLIKKDLGTNILNFGLLSFGVFLFFSLWPKNVEGSIQGSITFLPLIALFSLFLFLHEPISEARTPEDIEQVKAQKKWLVIVKNTSLIIAIVSFVFSLVFVIIFTLTPNKSGLAGIALIVPIVAMAAGVPIPMILYFFLKGKVARDEQILGRSSTHPSLEKATKGPINFNSLKQTILISLLILGLIFFVFVLINR